MLTIHNFEKLNGYNDGGLYIERINESINEYQIFVEYELILENFPIYISINRNKRNDVDEKFPNDTTPVYNIRIIQHLPNGRTKRKELGIKKKALESSNNIIFAIMEMLDDFINER